MPDWLGTLTGGIALVAGMYVIAACLWTAERRLLRRTPMEGTAGHVTLQRLRGEFVAGLRALVPIAATAAMGNRRASCLHVFLLCGTALLAFATVPFGPPGGTVPFVLVPEFEPGLLLVLALYLPGASGLQAAANADREHVRTLLELSVPLWLAGAGPAAASGTLQLSQIAARQTESGVWWFVEQPLGFAVGLVTMLILTTRSLPVTAGHPQEPESFSTTDETAGRHSPDGLRALAGYLHLILFAYLLVLLFFGGWHLWGLAPGSESGTSGWPGTVLRVVVLHGKVLAVLACLIVLRRSGLADELTERAGTIAPVLAVAGLVNFAVAGMLRTWLSPQAFLLKAAAGWGVLTLALGTIAWLSGRAESE